MTLLSQQLKQPSLSPESRLIKKIHERKIKFRAWSHHTNEIIEVDNEDLGYYLSGADGIELSQFTGFKDKNGKEIYEGDIVQFKRMVWYTQEEWNELKKQGKEPQYQTHTYEVLIPACYVIASGGPYQINFSETEVISNVFEREYKNA